MRTALQLAPLLPVTSGRRLNFLVIADPSQGKRDEAGRLLQAFDENIRRVKFYDSFGDLLALVDDRVELELDEDDDIYLIHDCSPTTFHRGNINAVDKMIERRPQLLGRLRFLVEKPALTSVQYAGYRETDSISMESQPRGVSRLMRKALVVS